MNIKKEQDLSVFYSRNNGYWDIRSKYYNNLKWAKDEQYINKIISIANFEKTDLVLEVGTGTGILLSHIAPLVGEIIGIDLSAAMLNKIRFRHPNSYFIRSDIRESLFKENLFDKVVARMVFHHILEDTDIALKECYRILKKGGMMIFAEGVPPCRELREDFKRIFALKEKRITFLPEDMVKLMEEAGFCQIKVDYYITREMSVRNWLDNSGLSEQVKEKIFNMHLNGTDLFKKAYNLKVRNNDCLIDTVNAIVTGIKK